jgi:hypothetical protein
MSYPAPTTGIGVAARVRVAGNQYIGIPSGKQLVPGYNNVVLSLSAANGPTTFQLNPEITDVANNVIALGTSYTLASVAASTGGAGILVASAVAASSDGEAIYTVTSGGTTNEWEGHSFVVAGFANASNNGTFEAVASTSTTLTLVNPFAVAETHAATATDRIGTAVYTGTFTGEATGSLVGKTFTVAGFVTNPTNNGTFIATANSGTTTLTLANPAAVAETHAATAQEEVAEWNAPITAVASATGVYTGTFTEFASYPVGAPVKITGFVTNAVNNGTFTLVSATATTITTSNLASIAETHAAIAAVNPDSVYTYFVDGSAQTTGWSATGPNTNLAGRTPVVSVSSNGLLTAGIEGSSVVEVSFPFASNQLGDIVSTGLSNPMNGLPLEKIYAEVNVTVLS